MDLKDVVATVKEKAIEAEKAFHAGHRDTAENYLGEVRTVINEYFAVPATPLTDVTGSATSENPEEASQTKPAQEPGAVLPASQFDPAAAAQQIGGSLTDKKPGQ